MPTIDEKRVYADKTEPTVVHIASDQGHVVADVAGDIVGEFRLARRCTARDVAVDEGTLALATDEDVLLGTEGASTGFGPAVAVEVRDRAVLAAAESGDVERLPPDGDGWEPLGTVESPRAIDGPLVAAADGVHRVVGGDLQPAGLAAVTDVAGAGVPLAATADGLYYLANGWMVAREGAHAIVDVPGDGRPGHAVDDHGTVLAGDLDEWAAIDPPTEERVIGVAYGDDVTVLATRGGILLASDGDGWRARSVGVTGVSGVDAP